MILTLPWLRRSQVKRGPFLEHESQPANNLTSERWKLHNQMSSKSVVSVSFADNLSSAESSFDAFCRLN